VSEEKGEAMLEALGVTRDTLLEEMGRPYSFEAVVGWRRGDRASIFLSQEWCWRRVGYSRYPRAV